MVRSVLLVLTATASLSAGMQNQLTAQDRADGWELIFDGKTRTGWLEITGRPFPRSWTIDDGCLKAIPNPDGVQDIRTRATYRDLEFSFEWRIAPGGNSGVKYLIQRTDEWQTRGGNGIQARARGFEYQLIDDANSTEARRDPSRATASLYSVLPPVHATVRPAGEFNESRILVQGDHVEHWLNGVKALEFDLREQKISGLLDALGRNPAGGSRRESAIGLQNHNSEVWFRNLKIRRLR